MEDESRLCWVTPVVEMAQDELGRRLVKVGVAKAEIKSVTGARGGSVEVRLDKGQRETLGTKGVRIEIYPYQPLAERYLNASLF